MAEAGTGPFEALGARISVTDKASPWQNGYPASFFGRCQDEMGDMDRCKTPGEWVEAICHYIHYYNPYRIENAASRLCKTIPQKVIENCLHK